MEGAKTPENQVPYDPVTLTLICIYNAIIIGMTIKWLIPEMRKLIKGGVE